MKKLLFLLLSGVLVSQNLEHYESIALRAYLETEVPSPILLGLMMAESGGDIKSISPYRKDGHRDEGLMQLNSKYLSYFSWKYNKGVKINPFDPETALMVAARILRDEYAYFGTWVEALAAYRQGRSGVITKGITHDSFHYVDKVFVYSLLFEEPWKH